MAAAVTAATARVEEAAIATVAADMVVTPLAALTDTASTLVAEATLAMLPAVMATAADIAAGSAPAGGAMAVAATVEGTDTVDAAIMGVVIMDATTIGEAEATTAAPTGAVPHSGLDSGMCLGHLFAMTLTAIQRPATCRLTAPTVTLPIEQGCRARES